LHCLFQIEVIQLSLCPCHQNPFAVFSTGASFGEHHFCACLYANLTGGDEATNVKARIPTPALAPEETEDPD